jgi:hypothetical protein
MHSVDNQIDLDALVDYTIINHQTDLTDTTNEGNEVKDELLAFMSGRTKSYAADICHVLAAKQAPDNKQEPQSELRQFSSKFFHTW